MRLAIISPSDFTVILCCKWIIKLLNKKGYDIYIISPKSKDRYFYNLISKLNVNFIEINMNRHLNIFDDLRYLFELYKIFKRENIEMVISLCTKPNVYAPIAAKFANAKRIIVSIWGRGTVFIENKSFKLLFIRSILLILYKISFIFSNKVWFTNKHDLNYFKSKFFLNKKKIIITPNYIDSDEFKPFELNKKEKLSLLKELNFRESDLIVILVGRMIFSKGIKEFIDASFLVNKLYSHVKFILVGPEEVNNPDSVPSNYLQQLKGYSYIKWVGFRKDIKQLYSISKIAVLPSYYPEGGYPRAITEPMSMGKAVIAANTENCRGPINDNFNGLLVAPKNSNDLSEKIISLISDQKKLDYLGRNARNTIIENFDEKKIIKQLLEHF